MKFDKHMVLEFLGDVVTMLFCVVVLAGIMVVW